MNKEQRNSSDTYHAIRETLTSIKESEKPLKGDQLFPILETMFQARTKKLSNQRTTQPDEFSFPGSRGEVRIEQVVENAFEHEGFLKIAYNVYFTGLDKTEVGIATIKGVGPGGDGKVGIGYLDLESGRQARGYWGNLDPDQFPNAKRNTYALCSELLTALNSLHKPVRS